MQNVAESYNGSGPAKSTFDFNSFIARIKAVLTDPVGTWPVIKAENLSIKDFYLKYFLALAAIPAICGFLGMQLFGLHIPLIGKISVPFFSSLTQQLIMFGLGALGIFVNALILQKLAPSFGGSATTIDALKLAGFSMIPASVAGILSIYPSGFLGLITLIISLYSIYVFWVGIPHMTAVPEEKKLFYTLASAICCIVVGFILNLLVMKALGPNLESMSPTLQTEAGEFDMKKFEEQMKQIQKILPNPGN